MPSLLLFLQRFQICLTCRNGLPQLLTSFWSTGFSLLPQHGSSIPCGLLSFFDLDVGSLLTLLFVHPLYLSFLSFLSFLLISVSYNLERPEGWHPFPSWSCPDVWIMTCHTFYRPSGWQNSGRIPYSCKSMTFRAAVWTSLVNLLELLDLISVNRDCSFIFSAAQTPIIKQKLY